MKIEEIISEALTFYGSKCTKDCSGHNAGWQWAKIKNKKSTGNCNSHSNSFNNGCAINVDQRANNRQPIGPTIRGEKGRFVKFKKDES